MRAWPATAIVAVALVLARALVTTPSLSPELQTSPDAETVRVIDEHVFDLVIGTGVTFLGLAFAGVFFAGLVRAARLQAPESLAAPLIALGGAVTVSATVVGYSFALILAGAAEEGRAPTTVASVYTIADSLGYIGWTPIGLVAVGVALASLRDGVFPRWLGWVSAVAAALFVLLAFLPFLSWAPALLWLLVAGIGLLVHERRARALPETSG